MFQTTEMISMLKEHNLLSLSNIQTLLTFNNLTTKFSNAYSWRTDSKSL